MSMCDTCAYRELPEGNDDYCAGSDPACTTYQREAKEIIALREEIARLRERLGQATAFIIGEDAQVKSSFMGKHGMRWYIKIYDEHGEWFLYGGVKQQFGGGVDGTYESADAAFAALEAYLAREKGESE